VERELERDPNAAWVERASARPVRFDEPLDTPGLLDEVRESFDR
jgi:hypothetical protein